MKIIRSLPFLIIAILTILASSTLYLGYYLNIHTLRETLESRELEKLNGTFGTAKSIIMEESEELLTLIGILKTTQSLNAGLKFYYQSGGDLAPLKKAMDQLYPQLKQMEFDIFLVTDKQGRLIYRADLPEAQGKKYAMWGMDEALAGEAMLSAGKSREGWSVQAMAPLFDAKRRLAGVIILGMSLGNEFAQKISQSLEANLSFSALDGIQASSLPRTRQNLVNPQIVKRSILEKRQFFHYDAHEAVLYKPLRVADETFCLIMNSDTTAITAMLAAKRSQLVASLLTIFIIVVALGAALTVVIISPLRRLQRRAQQVSKELTEGYCPIKTSGNEIRDLSQAFDLLVTSVNQYTDGLNRAQEELRTSERFLANIFASIQDGISILDKEYNIIRVNSTMEQVYAHSMPLVGKKCYRAYHGLSSPCESCPSRRTLETGEPAREEVTELDGELTAHVEINTFPFIDLPAGKMTGVVEYVRNITEKKQSEEALRRSEEQLRQAVKMEAVGRLAGGVAHDFNNILTAIIGYSELLLMNLPPGDPQRSEVEDIRQAAERAASLTRQLLAFSRKQVLQPRRLDLNRVVADLDKMLRRIIGEDIDLVTVLGENLGTVQADPGQIEQVVMNLAVNARDAMPQGGKLTLETANVDLDAAYAERHLEVQTGPYVMLAVSDTGSGLDPDSKAHLFEPFFTTKEMGKGTGLGLSTVYGIIKQSGGLIWVYSEPGKGTTFKIYLPRLEGAALATEGARALASSDWGSETILLVEDEDLVRQVARRILERYGYTVLAAASGQEALALSREHAGPIHLMLTDVVMPGMSGQEIREDLQPQRPEMEVLFMSGHTENAIVHHGVLDEGTAFIQKPFKHEVLAHKVREILDNRAAG
jgi:PAS domain S-box-containing protein